MSNPEKQSRANPLASVQRRELTEGLRGLELALNNLSMSSAQKGTLLEVLRANTQRLAAAGKPKGEARKATASTGPKKSEVALPKLGPKQRAAQLRLVDKLHDEKRRTHIESTHKKSGFTTFVRRAPGSFEGGKK